MTLVLIIGAWLIGYYTTNTNVEALVIGVLPQADRVAEQGGIFTGYDGDKVVGYAAVGQGTGYSGPVKVLVGVNTSGEVIGIQIVEHRETPSFFRQLGRESYYNQFIGSGYAQPMLLTHDIDGVSGATLSAEAVATAIRQATRTVAIRKMGADVTPLPRSIEFGVPEIVLLALFATGYAANRSRNKTAKKWIRWITLLTGGIVLGFILNKPLTLANFISLLSGYWPDWHTNLYWYLLLGGILFVTTTQGKNPYCYWFCPFGSVQEVLGQVAGAKLYMPRRLQGFLRWLPRSLALTAILLGLIYRNPAAASYEIFGTIFGLTGSAIQFALLALVLLASIVLYRPWCNYLCPLGPVVDYIGAVRRWGKELWRNRLAPQ